MTVKLSDLVRYNDEITTINELDKRGLINYVKIDNFQTKRGTSIKYFADIKTDGQGWEIGKLAYLSKTKQEISI